MGASSSQGRALPPAPPIPEADDEDGYMPPPPRSPGFAPEPSSPGFAPPPRSGRSKSPRKPKGAQDSAQPAPPRTVPEPGGGLRDAGAKTEEERLLELEALDAACALIVDETDAPPMEGRQVGR